MIDWWFIWHFITPPNVPEGNGNLRYKIWCPNEHWDTGVVDKKDEKRYLDQAICLRAGRNNMFLFLEYSLTVKVT